ncbi:hypothetical protein HYH02_006197 [Chlamydomonas schloesseri]|uniref:Uncharacterized protein n=1 Tax=Chlamydomonas schloesseri TaxID=2026947 RepID=A0A835WKQ6_9CHLO|nr:hypothetical protein HYH02_006197 [Chlamydomonas schloesseri]|eukprot:KAG2448846.1 hypothetical protein HYH02_006197 [Chlamydomonas schloesseri]
MPQSGNGSQQGPKAPGVEGSKGARASGASVSGHVGAGLGVAGPSASRAAGLAPDSVVSSGRAGAQPKAAAGAAARTSGFGARASGTPSGSSSGAPPLKSSLKAGLPRTVRATGRPVELAPLSEAGSGVSGAGAGHEPALGLGSDGRHASPDPMRPRPGSGGAAALPALPRTLSSVAAGSSTVAGAVMSVTVSADGVGPLSHLPPASPAAALTTGGGSRHPASPPSQRFRASLTPLRDPPQPPADGHPHSPGADFSGRSPGSASQLLPGSPNRRMQPGLGGSMPPARGSRGGSRGGASPLRASLASAGGLGLSPAGRNSATSPNRMPRGNLSPGAAGSAPVSPGGGRAGSSAGARSPGGHQRPGSKQQAGSAGAGAGAKAPVPTRSRRHMPDPMGLLDVLTTAPGVIGEVQISPELWCMDVWKVLDGGCPQQRAWTFGSAAVTNAAAALAALTSVDSESGTAARVAGASGGETYTSPQPLAVLSGVVFKHVTAGSHHAAAVSEDGRLYLWGSDSRGQLGRGWAAAQHVACHPLPHEVALPMEASLEDMEGRLPDSLVQGIAASTEPKPSTEAMLAEATAAEETPETYVPPGPLALFPMPQVHAAGLAPADASSISMLDAAPGDMKAAALVAAAGGSRVAGMPGAAIAAVSVAAAASSSTNVSISGAMGDGMATVSGGAAAAAAAVQVAAAAGGVATSAAANEAAAAAAATAAKRTMVMDNLHVYRLMLGLPVRTVACGALHTLAALEGGGVMGWGDNASGQATGRAGVPAVRVGAPTRIVDFEGVEVLCLSAGLTHSAAVTAKGVLYTWGSNRHGRLGLGPGAGATHDASPRRDTRPPGPDGGHSPADGPSSSAYPQPYSAKPMSPPRSPKLLTGPATSPFLQDPLPTTAAMLAHAGMNPDGLHDDAKRGMTHPPTPVTFNLPPAGKGAEPGPPLALRVVSVACGFRHTLALTDTGDVWAWGSNATQALGLSDFDDRSSPVPVPSLPPVTAIAAGSVSAAICGEGRLFLWGADPYLNPWVQRNRAGGPGSNVMTPRSALQPVIHRVRWLGPHRFRSVSLGSRHAVAVTTHQRLYWWGDEDVLPGAMQYGAAKLPNRCPAPEDYLALPVREEDSDRSVPPPPPPPPEAMDDNSGPGGGTGASQNRLTAFRLFSSRDAPRPSDELGGAPPGGLASPSRSRAPSMWGMAPGQGAGGPLSPHVLDAAFGGGVDGAGEDAPDPLTVRLSVFNGRVFVSIRHKPQRLTGLGLTRNSSPLRRMRLRSQAGALSMAGMGGGGSSAGLRSNGGSNTQIANEASLAAGLAPLGSGPPSPTARSAGAAGGIGGSGAANSTGGGVPTAAGGFGAGSGAAAAAAAAASGGTAGSLFSGDEPVMMVACGEGQTVCLCGQTRYSVSLDETRHALMLVLRQYARHWHATRRLSSTRLAAVGGSPKRVRARTADRRPSSARSLRSFFTSGRGGGGGGGGWFEGTAFPAVELEERPADPRDELASLDMLLVFCRQAGLIDNISEYNDVIELYRIQITNKQARIPPSQQQLAEMGGPGTNNPTGPVNMLPVRLHSPALDASPSQRTLSDQPSDGARPGGRVGFGSFPPHSGGNDPGAGASPLNSRGTFTRFSSSLGMGGSQPTTPAGGSGGLLPGNPGGGLYGEASLALIPEDNSVCDGGAGSALAGNPSALSLGGEGGEGPVPGTPPSLRIVDMRQFMPHADLDETSGPDERLHDSEVLDLLLGLMQNRQLASQSLAQHNLPLPALMRQLAARFFSRLRGSACTAPMPWVLGQVIRTEMLRALDSGPNSLTLHQAYIFLTSERSAPQDLHLSMQDMRLGLAQVEQPFTVPLMRLAQFIRQSGMLPRLLSRLISHMHKAAEYYLDRLTVAEQVPWWWPPEVLRERRAAVSGIGLGAVSSWVRADMPSMWVVPHTNNLLGIETLAGVVYDFDILGVTIGTTRKALRNQLTSEEQLALEQAKRDRLLAYVLVHLFGQYLVPVSEPWDMRPDRVLNHPVSYPQFIEILSACLSVKAASQSPTGALMPSVQLLPTLGDTLQHLPALLEAIGLWREKILYPWKFNRVKHNDVELQRQVDRAFSLYCTIDPLAQTLGINIYQFTQLIRDTDMADKTLTMERIQEVFAAVALVRVRNVPALKHGKDRPQSRQNENMEWTGLTAAQIIRLSTSQFAYTVAQHKLEEHLMLREQAISGAAGGRQRSPQQHPPGSSGGRGGAAGAGAGAGAEAGGGGTPAGGGLSLAMALKAAAQRSAHEVEAAEAGVGGPGPQRPSWVSKQEAAPPTTTAKRPSGLQAQDLAGPSSPGPGSPTTRSRSITGASGGGLTAPGGAMSSASAAAAAAAVFITKLKRPGRNGGSGSRTRDLAGILRSRTQSNQMSFDAGLDASGLPAGLTALVMGMRDMAAHSAHAQALAGLDVPGGGGAQQLQQHPPHGPAEQPPVGFSATDEEDDLGLSWPSFTTEHFADSEPGTPVSRSAANTSPGSSPGAGGGGFGTFGFYPEDAGHGHSRNTSPLRPSGFSPSRQGRPPLLAPSTAPGDGRISPAAALLEDAQGSPGPQAAGPQQQQQGAAMVRGEPSMKTLEVVASAQLPPEDPFEALSRAGGPGGPLPPPPPPPLTDESDASPERRRGGAGGGGRVQLVEPDEASQRHPAGSGAAGARGRSARNVRSARNAGPGGGGPRATSAVSKKNFGFGSGVARKTMLAEGVTAEDAAAKGAAGKDGDKAAAADDKPGGKGAASKEPQLQSQQAAAGTDSGGGANGRHRSPGRSNLSRVSRVAANDEQRARSPSPAHGLDPDIHGGPSTDRAMGSGAAGDGAGPSSPSRGPRTPDRDRWVSSPDRAGRSPRTNSVVVIDPALGPAGAMAAAAAAGRPLSRDVLMRLTGGADGEQRPGSRGSLASPLHDVLGDSLGSPPRSPLRRIETSSSSSESEGEVIGGVNRLVMTKHDLATSGGGKGAKKLSAQPGTLLTREQFSEVIQRLAVIKYSKISSPMAAWRLLIERHVLPVVETRSTKFDKYLEEMMGPSIMSLVLAWEPQLKALFRIYGKEESKQTTGKPPGAHHASRPGTAAASRPGSRSASRPGTAVAGPSRPVTARANSTPRPGTSPSRPTTAKRGRSPAAHNSNPGTPPPGATRSNPDRITMSFVQFLQLCQDRKVIPALIQPAGLEEIFRRVNFMDGVESYIQNMAYPQFVDAVCLTGMTIYHHPRYKEQGMSVEDMLETFFSQLCSLKRARTRQNQARSAIESTAAAAAAAVRGANAGKNPYAEWWSLRFEKQQAGAGGHTPAWSYLSSVEYAPVLLQELVMPPPPVPEAVDLLLARAADLHNRGDCPAALEAFERAAAAWRAAVSGEGTLPLGASLALSPEQEIYLCLARASVLMSCGRDGPASALYDCAEEQLARLPEGHMAEPLIHGCRGHLLYHCGQLQAAFEHLVQAKVLREQHPDLGSHHVDTALSHHNLACCLDRLGKTHMALRLLGGAADTFRVVLGPTHPRTTTATRNLQHMQHRLMKLDLKYRSVAQEQAEAEQHAVIEALHRAAGRGLRGRRPGVDPVAGAGGLNAPGMPLALRREQANAALAAAAAAAAVLAPRRLEPLKMSAKDRLAAFQLRVHGGGGGGGASASAGHGDEDSPPGSPASGSYARGPAYTRGRNGVKYYRSKHDPDYLGGGLHRPHPDVVATYEAVRADIAAHAAGAVHARVPEGTVVIQRGAGAGGHQHHGGVGGHRGGHHGLGEDVPGPVRAFRGGVLDKTLQARKYKVERRFGMPPPPSESAQKAQRQHLQAVNRGLQARRANVLAAAMLEELNARLTGAEVEREAPVTDRLADVLTGTAATAAAGGLPGRGGKAGAGWEDDDESDAASLRSLRM